MYSFRARIGMLLPSSNTAAEPQIYRLLPEGVSFHTTRLKLTGSSEHEIDEMVERVESAALLLADAKVDLIVFHCTAASMSRRGFDDDVIARITAATGIPATATSKAVLAALRSLGAPRIVLVTPYTQETHEREVAFLESHQIAVVGQSGMGLRGTAAMFAIEPGEWYRRTRAQRHPDADAYFISCTALRSVEAIAPLEEDLGRPVISSTQAMVWYALRITGVRALIHGYGRLMEIAGPAALVVDADP